MRGFTAALYAHPAMRRAILIAVLALRHGRRRARRRPTRSSRTSRARPGNINCIGGTAPAYVECQARAARPGRSRRPKPIGCDLDWEPYNLSLGSRRVDPRRLPRRCRARAASTTARRCATGKSVDIGPIRCRSAANGVTCRYVRGKHAGFRIAREGYVIWRS